MRYQCRRHTLLAFLWLVAGSQETQVDAAPNVTFWYDEDVTTLIQGDVYVVSVNYSVSPGAGVVDVSAVVEDEGVALVKESYLPALAPANRWEVLGANITLTGVLLGKTSLTFRCRDRYEDFTVPGPAVHVLRPYSPLDDIFTVVVAVLVAINTIAFSCALDLKVVRGYLKKPIGVSIGFSCQYVMMPLIAFGLSRVFSLQDSLAFGLLCYGSSPGGGFSNIYTILLRGDLNLSVTMTLVSTLASLAMTSLWLFTLGRELNSSVSIPYPNILISLGTLVVTCVIGLLIGRFLPKVARVLQKVIRPLAALIIVFILTVGVYANRYIFLLMGSWRVALAAVLVSWSGYLLSLGVALALRQPWRVVRTIAIETGVQNGGVALLILRWSLPQPDADLSTVAPIMAVMTSALPLVLAAVVMAIVRRVRGERSEAAEGNTDETDSGGTTQMGYSNPAMSEYFSKLDGTSSAVSSEAGVMQNGSTGGASEIRDYFSKLEISTVQTRSVESSSLQLSQSSGPQFESFV